MPAFRVSGHHLRILGTPAWSGRQRRRSGARCLEFTRRGAGQAVACHGRVNRDETDRLDPGNNTSAAYRRIDSA